MIRGNDMDTIKITFDNQEHNYPINTSYYEISKEYHSINSVLAIKIKNQIF